MTKAKTAWLLLGILLLASFAVAQDTAWEKYMEPADRFTSKGTTTRPRNSSWPTLLLGIFILIIWHYHKKTLSTPA